MSDVIDIRHFHRPIDANQTVGTQREWYSFVKLLEPYHPALLNIPRPNIEEHLPRAMYTGKVSRIVSGTAGGENMTDPTREEIDAKLAVIEARTETRFVELSGKIDRVIDTINRSNIDFVKINGDARADMKELRVEMQDVKRDNKSTRTTIIATIIAAVIAGLGALWVTQSNLLASFQAGLAIHESAIPQTSWAPAKSPTPSPTH